MPPRAMVVRSSSASSTVLRAYLPEEEWSESQREVMKIAETWHHARFLSREEAVATLEPKWLEAYNRYFTKYDDDMTRMAEIAQKVAIMIEPPRVQKKTKGQARRDKWAKLQARTASRAAVAAYDAAPKTITRGAAVASLAKSDAADAAAAAAEAEAQQQEPVPQEA